LKTPAKPKYCPTTKITYTSTNYVCPPETPSPTTPPTTTPETPPTPTPTPITPTTPPGSTNNDTSTTFNTKQYCEYTKEYYYSKAYKCSASGKLHTDAVIGGVVGGVVVFVLIMIGAYLVYKKKKEAKNQVSPLPETPSIKVSLSD